MKFIEKVEKLQKENEGSIILVKSGIFFVGIGKDAVLLQELLDLKVTCMKPETCKVGFPVKNIEKYIQLLTEKGKSFAIYITKGETTEEIYRYKGEPTTETRTCLECAQCANREETEKDILERVKKLGKS